MISSLPLAAGATRPLLLIVVGVAVAALLIVAFWWGSHRIGARGRLSAASRQARSPQPRSTSWQTPDDDPDQGNPHR